MPTGLNVLNTIDVVAIVVGLVSLIVSIVVFFASVIFFLRGQKLQDAATRALVLIEEKSANIETRVSGMFDKTLDAALSKNEDVTEEFESLQQKLEASAEELSKRVAGEITGIGKEKKEEVLGAVKKEFQEISAQLKDARDSLSESTSPPIEFPARLQRSGMARKVLKRLLSSEITGKEAAEQPRLFKSRLESLCELGVVVRDGSGDKAVYRLSDRGRGAAKRFPGVQMD